MYDYLLASGFSGIVIATKKDKISKSSVKKNIDNIARKLKAPVKENIIPFSSVDKDEVDELWYILEDIIKFKKS